MQQCSEARSRRQERVLSRFCGRAVEMFRQLHSFDIRPLYWSINEAYQVSIVIGSGAARSEQREIAAHRAACKSNAVGAWEAINCAEQRVPERAVIGFIPEG
jgi:hypothetical protein